MNNVIIQEYVRLHIHDRSILHNYIILCFSEFHAIYNINKHSIYKKIEVAKIITRELIHQWFNLVTPIWWSYLWLKEGFVTFLESYIIDKVI